MLKMLTALIVLFLAHIWSATAGASLLHYPCFAGVFQSQQLKQCAVYIPDKKEEMK
jgi:hypothetical protein